MPWIRVTPRSVARPVESCLHCQAPIDERWEPAERLCASCALESDLFDRDNRRERLAGGQASPGFSAPPRGR